MIPQKTLKSGFTLPVLGLGTWLMGGNMEKIPSPQDEIDIKALRTAIEMGYTHIDTAESYAAGYTEELLGQAIQGHDRKSLFIASKASQGHHTVDLLEKALDQSLNRLGTDYLDLYYLHRPTLDTPFAETAKALNKAVKDGKIKHIGVCNFSPANMDKLQQYLDTPIVANQVHYNLVFREPEKIGMFTHAQDKDYFIVAWRPLRLVRQMIDKNLWERGAFPLLDQIADKNQKTNVQAALNWTVHQPNTATLIKSSCAGHLQEAIASFDKPLEQSDYDQLSRDFTPILDVSDAVPLV